MKVLMISGDRHLLEPGSPAYDRLQLQRSQVEQLDVFVWPQVHSAREISLAAQKNKYDIITAQDPFWRGLLAWRLARRTGAKLNIQVHTDLGAQSLARRVLARIVLRHADSVRVVSEKIRGQAEAIGVRASVHVRPIFVDVSRFKDAKPEPHAQKTILWIGRFEAEKDPLYAVRILKEVRAKVSDAKLVMLGAGTLEPVVRQIIEGLPIELPGWQDPGPYLRVADVVLCTSRHESWGASIIEALAAGVPVVSPDVGIAREAGAIVVPRSELASAVGDALQSGTRGELRIPMPSREEWARRWKETLI